MDFFLPFGVEDNQVFLEGTGTGSNLSAGIQGGARTVPFLTLENGVC